VKDIKHIVYLMLENRSFDNVLGWLYDDAQPPKVNLPEGSSPAYHGLKENTYFNVDKDGIRHYVQKGTGHDMNIPRADPHEEYSHVNKQLFGNEANPEPLTEAKMIGFYQDFAEFDFSLSLAGLEAIDFNAPAKEIMMTYTPEELPVLNGLARNFAVSDYYFASVPTQTNTNRAFAACGNSLGINENNQLESWVNNRQAALGGAGEPYGRQFNQKTMWNVLSDNNKNTPADWMIYSSHDGIIKDTLKVAGYSYTKDIMEQLQGESLDEHFGYMGHFFENAKAGTLPSVCFLEPAWGGGATSLVGAQGNDYHPPTNLAPGEQFVKSIYDALTSNKDAWEQTLFIINFDEHGGTYDHISPPWNAAQPWASDGTPEPSVFEEGFKFDRFGVRVPLILVSPHVQASTVFRAEGDTPYDHTSVIATILNVMGIPKEKWGLGARTANAPTFEHVFTGNTLRTDIPEININANGKESAALIKSAPLNDIQKRRDASLKRVNA